MPTLVRALPWLAALSLLLAPGRGHAQALDQAAMRPEMHRYFAGERAGGIWLMGVGAPAAALGAGLLFVDHPFARGLAYTELAMGAAEFLGGLVFYLNTRSRVPRFDRQISTDPAAFQRSELPRIQRVNRDMRLLEAVEITLFLAGGAMTAIAAHNHQDLLAGIGTGVMLNSAILLIYDQLAARRALRYTDALSRFQAGASASPGGALLHLGARF